MSRPELQTELQDVIAYHYSPLYRDMIATAIVDAELDGQIVQDPKTAYELLTPGTKALIVPYERFTEDTGEDDSNTTGLQVDRPALSLIQFAEAFNTPWALITGPTPEPPYGLLGRAPSGSTVITTGDAIATSAREQLDLANSPDEATQDRIIGALTHWLLRLP